MSTAFARSISSGPIGVGRFSVTAKSEVTVHGGDSSPWACISATVAAQFEWQSSSAPTMPPFSTPGNAWWCSSGRQRATRWSPSSKLRIRSPLGLLGPQPKHALWGAKRSWTLGPSMGHAPYCGARRQASRPVALLSAVSAPSSSRLSVDAPAAGQ